MRERELGINVRVNQSEKRKLEMNARKRRLSLSAYLRKAGLEKEMQAPPPQRNFRRFTTKSMTSKIGWTSLTKA